ncbi:hypothetical protein EHQ53_16920 [Leptospira langatensis]|uniref:Uncharacterized protein n=1 Tax=Leptospira langatensis TaxID=2484983 RepID=A0A5F1ZNI4_9LEPT|nr:hypothetical protein [Leptospira langatensis]TGK05321.1 hypothetical protein EHO57_01160 [Leptospira langatensis]TGL38457.1 hypothetical protein EHQ53_16920 [Leptospira langatensis]
MTSIRKLIFVGGFIVFLVISLTILFWTDDETADPKSKKGEADALAGLFGGGMNSSSSGASNGGRTSADKSLFESSFFTAGKAEYREADTAQTENKQPESDANNPVNPQTGKPYTNEEMDRFQQLKEKFPNNSLLPSRMTPAEKEQKKALEQRVSEATRAVLGRTASKDQIVTYYDFMEKQSKDRLEIVKYLVDIQKGSGDPDQEKKLENIQQTMIQQLDQVQKDKQRAFEQAGL